MCASSHFATSPCGSDEHSLMWFQSMDCDCATVFHCVLCYAGVPRVAKIPVKQTEGMCASPFLQYAPANLMDMVECDFQAMDCDCATVFHFRICYARVPRATTLSCRTRPARCGAVRAHDVWTTLSCRTRPARCRAVRAHDVWTTLSCRTRPARCRAVRAHDVWTCHGEQHVVSAGAQGVEGCPRHG